MSIQMYFINETKKQVIDSKLLYGDFEDKQQLLTYLSFCQGDIIRTDFKHSQWVEDFIYNNKHKEYKRIKLYEYNIYVDDDLYSNKEVDRLYNDINKETD